MPCACSPDVSITAPATDTTGGTAVVLVSHDLRRLTGVAGRVLTMTDGRLTALEDA